MAGPRTPRDHMPSDYDAIIVGAGPAGLSAALVLGRCRRSVLVVDGGRTRNYAARRVHNYLTRDGVAPARFLELARAEAARYGVAMRRGMVTAARRVADGFAVHSGRSTAHARVLLLATGVVDELPPIANLRAFYGRGVHHCPYCDGWEYRGRRLAAYGPGRQGIGLAMSLRTWSADVTVVTHGEDAEPMVRRTAARLGIAVRTEPVERFRSRRGAPRASESDPLGLLEFRSGADLRVDAFFFNTDKVQRSRLPVRLGCRMTPEGGVLRDRRQRTGIPGLYLAGDASADVQFVIVAAAEGAKAGVAMNRELQDRDRAAAISAGRRAS